MQSARHLVASAAELAAGVQLGKHDLHRRNALLRVNVDRNTSAVIRDGNGSLGGYFYVYGVAIAGKRLVHAVVHYFDDKVMKPPLVGRSDVHSGTFTNRLQPFEHLNFA